MQLIHYAQKLSNNVESQVIFYDATGQIKNNRQFRESIRLIEQVAPNHISLMSEQVIENDFLNQQDLMLVSFESWKQLVESKSTWLQGIPSTLIIRE